MAGLQVVMYFPGWGRMIMDVYKDITVPNGVEPEFPCPDKFLGNPVIWGRYVEIRPGTVPFWVVIIWDKNANGDNDYAYHVARMIASGESTQTRYHVGSAMPLASQRYEQAQEIAELIYRTDSEKI